MGYHWYGEMDYFYLLMLRDNFSLTGGDSLYPAAVAYCLNSEPTGVWLRPNSSKEARTPEEIFQNPDSLSGYVGAYIAVREKSGRRVPDEIIHAAAILCGSEREGYGVFVHPTPDIVSEARSRLVAAAQSDPEAAVTVALPYVMRYRVRGPRDKATSEKLELMRELPPEAVIPIVQRLAENLQNQLEAALCHDLLERLREPAQHRESQLQ